MSKIEKGKRYLVFIIGLFINSFGVSFITKAQLGTSPISSIPYVLSLKFVWTLGVFTILFSCLLIAGQILILGKKFNPENLLQFPVSIAFGLFIDFSMRLLSWLAPASFVTKLLSLVIGCVILGFGVWVEVIADVVMLPGESFVRAITQRFGTEFGTTKVCFDASMTVIAGLISFLFFGALNGVGIGTVIAAIVVGFIAKAFGKLLKEVPSLLFSKKEAPTEAQAAAADHLVITIAREYGCKGEEIGKALSAKLGIAFYDKDILALTSKEMNRSEDYVKANEQKLTHSLIFDLYMQSNAYAEDEDNTVHATERRVIREIAGKESCVIMGRLSNFILADMPGAYHIHLHADMEQKIKNVMEAENLSRKAAKEQITRIERDRRDHCFASTGKIWGLSQYYDLAIDTGKLGVDTAADLISQVVFHN